MEDNLIESNSVILAGKVASEKEFSHEIYGEKFYTFNLSVPRLSGNSDIIPITISERLFKNDDLKIGNKMKVKGQFRSYNSYVGEKNKLVLTVFAKDVEFLSEDADISASKDFISNEITLYGYICKLPVYRQTPFGREITDMLLAVNRAYNKSDYIPCICWGRNARFCSKLEVGAEVKVVGRIQSRTYEKKHEDGTVEQKVAYEVSISNLEIIKSENVDANEISNEEENEANNNENKIEVNSNKENVEESNNA